MGVIQVHAVMKVKPGREAALVEALTAGVATSRGHEGVLSYQFYRNAEGSFVALETYKDAASLTAHMAGVGAHMAAITDAISEMSVSLFGPVPEELKAAVAQMRPAYFEHVTGFTLGA